MSMPAELRAKLRSAFGTMLGSSSEVALIDFPNHSNVGDNAIWCGERELLHQLGIRVVYASDPTTHSDDEMRRRTGAATPILLHGGGNFGDLWPKHHEFRLHILRTHPDRPIVQLPQTVHLHDPVTLEETRIACERHPRFHLFVRDGASLDFVRSELPDTPVTLAPDSALALGAPPRRTPSADVLWLTRRDHEAGGHVVPDAELLSVDWADVSATRADVLLRRLRQKTIRRLSRARAGTLPDLRVHLFDRLANARLSAGLDLLGRGEVVVTDRLHGHILCLVLEIPHVLLRDANGKVEGFWRTWTRESGAALATDADEAAHLAAGLVGRLDRG